MTNDEVIARQAKEIMELNDLVTDLKERIEAAAMVIFCIGGPLSDNKLGCSPEQLRTIRDIANAFAGALILQ